jgi:hypothetical protein
VSLLRLTTSQRFTAFLQSGIHFRQPKPTYGRSERFPAAPFTPLEEYRSHAAVLCHHSRCPLDVTAPNFVPKNSAGFPASILTRKHHLREESLLRCQNRFGSMSVRFAAQCENRCRKSPSLHSQTRSHLQGLTPLANPYCCKSLPTWSTAYPSMGFVPFQGPIRVAAAQPLELERPQALSCQTAPNKPSHSELGVGVLPASLWRFT